jgi:hypothetical protein
MVDLGKGMCHWWTALYIEMYGCIDCIEKSTYIPFLICHVSALVNPNILKLNHEEDTLVFTNIRPAPFTHQGFSYSNPALSCTTVTTTGVLSVMILHP